MKKIDLSERLDRKNSVIAIVCILVFLIAGFVAAIVSHSSYLKNAESKIVNYGVSSSSSFHLRAGTLSTLVYKYADNATVVDLDDVIEVSKGATYSVDLVLNAERQTVEHRGTKFDVSNGQRYFLLITVKSIGNLYRNKYVLELVKKSDYTEETPDFNVQADGETPFITIDD